MDSFDSFAIKNSLKKKKRRRKYVEIHNNHSIWNNHLSLILRITI